MYLVNNNLRIEIKGEDTRGNESLIHHILKEWGSVDGALSRKPQSDFPFISNQSRRRICPRCDFGKCLILY